MESRNILALSQFSYRKGLCTTDILSYSLSIFNTDIRKTFAKREYLVGVFLDVASAYNVGQCSGAQAEDAFLRG